MEELIKEMEEIMSADFDQNTEQAGEILKLLDKVSLTETRIHLLTHFIENFGLLPFSGQKMKGEKMDDALFQTIREKLEKNGILEKLMMISEMINPPPLIAAQMLLSMLENCVDSQDKRVLLAMMMMFRFTPYLYCPHALKMENEKYVSLVEKRKREINKIHFLLLKSFSQKTEQASEILKIIESAPDFEERVILLTQLMARMESKNHISVEVPAALKEQLAELAAEVFFTKKKLGGGEVN